MFVFFFRLFFKVIQAIRLLSVQVEFLKAGFSLCSSRGQLLFLIKTFRGQLVFGVTFLLLPVERFSLNG